MIIEKMAKEKEILEIISSGRVNEFIDNLTLLTACDIAGQSGFIPLNSRIENLEIYNRFLKKIFRKIIKYDKGNGEYYVDEDGKDQFYEALRISMDLNRETRLCRNLAILVTF